MLVDNHNPNIIITTTTTTMMMMMMMITIRLEQVSCLVVCRVLFLDLKHIRLTVTHNAG